jgi:hypothetical protein
MIFRSSRLLRLALLLLFAAARPALADFYETPEFAEAVARTEEYVAQYGADQVLLVLDIDNTLLASDTALGSDQWFDWQEYLLAQEPDSPHLVADDFPGLLNAQGMLFTLGSMHPPQADLPELIREVQASGVKTLVLTSRGDEFRTATQRELRANGYDLAKSALATKESLAAPFLPYDLEDLAAAGLSTTEAEAMRLKPAKPATYRDGIFMTAGQHKGAMLIAMLHRANKPYKAIVYVDDHNHHVVRVMDALLRRGVDVSGFHYLREENLVDAFRFSDKADVTRQWRRLDRTLKRIFEVEEPAATAEK